MRDRPRPRSNACGKKAVSRSLRPSSGTTIHSDKKRMGGQRQEVKLTKRR